MTPTQSDLKRAQEILNSEFKPEGPQAIDLNRLYSKIASALAEERKSALEKTIQVLNDYPDITVDDLATIKAQMYAAFDALQNQQAGEE